ncbi:class I SAM-dependent methyltransferase [Echinicola sp. 20G]|uniref:class I SAM-dependent methyltransferase n=1 Tax=Echinicola sp. 20G TaxID=2781961 RepID=UPI0019106E71|nr:class I SAM-dependent methyltransferase [Echinicola sp. 20G]
MKQSFTEEDLKAIAAQLSHPKGEMGIEVGDTMHESNITMTKKAIELCHFEGKELLLEIGHGNANHLSTLLTENSGLNYTGLEISDLMYQQAQMTNEAWIKSGRASFHVYDGQKIPFEKDYFDQIMTVNTIYFWKEPSKMAQDIYRVLQPEGRFTIAFAQKEFMETLPFTKYGFTFYDDEKVEELMYHAGFTIVEQVDVKETVKSKALEEVEREYTVMSFYK